MADNKNNNAEPAGDFDIVAEVGEMIEFFTTSRGLPAADGQALASAVTDHLRETYGGERFSIRRSWGQRHQIAAVIRAEFTGDNIDELVERHGISRASVYRIVAARCSAGK